MGKIFLTSDTHFGHNREFLWGPRGFRSIWEHDEAIIANWNSVVGPEDDVYVLGDLMLGDNKHGVECVERLNGTIHLIRGNHDTDTRWDCVYPAIRNIYEFCGYATIIKYKKFHFYLSHFPTLTNNYDDKELYKKLINLCGHSHTKDPYCDQNKGIIYHVELDAHQNCPILLDNIISDIKINSFGHF